MSNFVEEYPGNKAQVLASAIREAGERTWWNEIDDDLIYNQIASPEFKLYEEVIFSEAVNESRRSGVYSTL